MPASPARPRSPTSGRPRRRWSPTARSAAPPSTRRLRLPAQPGRLRQHQGDARPSTTPLARRRSGAPARSPASTRSTCGSAAWPRRQNLFGGLLGSTFDYIFRTQMEALQDGDRLYYLPRIEGIDFEDSLQDSSLAQLIRANTGIQHLPGNIFLTPEYTVEASDLLQRGRQRRSRIRRQRFNTSTWLRNPVTGKLLVNIDARRDGAVRRRRQLPRQHHGAGRHRGQRQADGRRGRRRHRLGRRRQRLDRRRQRQRLPVRRRRQRHRHRRPGDDIIHGDDRQRHHLSAATASTPSSAATATTTSMAAAATTASGGLGNDIIIGDEGDDEMIGNEGDDWIEAAAAGRQLMFGDFGAPTGRCRCTAATT